MLKTQTLTSTHGSYFEFKQVKVSDGTLELLKWIALVSMTCSHVNYSLFNKTPLPFLTEFGCIAFPIFGFVLAYNLARPNALVSGLHLRALKRMLATGLVAIPFYIATFYPLEAFLPLNIMFTLLLATSIIFFIEKNNFINLCLSILLFVFLSPFVSGLWFTVAYCLGVWCYCKKSSLLSFMIWLISLLGLTLVYPTMWGLAILPIVFLATQMNFNVPRFRFAFYAYYPLHLIVLFLIKYLMVVA